MKYHIQQHLDGIILWYGDIEDDYGQFGIVNGEWAFAYLEAEEKMFQDNNQTNDLEYLILELPDEDYYSEKVGKRTSSYEKAIDYFVDYLKKYNKDKHDIIKILFNKGI